MKIEFGKLKIRNFLSFAEEEFDFSEHRKMALVCGKNLDLPGSKNGVGKSAMFSALLYVLYGQLQNKVKNENMKNRYVTSKDMELTLDFSVDGKKYIVSRGLTNGKSSFLKLVSLNPETDLTKSSIAETDDFLTNEILHCDISIFSRVAYLTSEQTYNFFRLKLQPKKEFIQKLFDIGIFEDMYKLIHKDILESDKTIFGMQSQLLSLTNNKADYEAEIGRFEEERKKILLEADERIADLEKSLEELKSKSQGLLVEDMSDTEKEISILNEKYIKGSDAITKVIRKVAQLEAEKSSLVSENEMKQKMVSKHSSFIGQLCDKCAPKARKFFSITSYDEDISRNKDEISRIGTEIESFKDKKVKLEEKVSQLKNKIVELSSRIRENSEKAREAKDKVDSVATRLANARSDKERALNDANPYTKFLDDVNGKIEIASKTIDTLSNETEYLKMAESIVAQDSIKKYIVSDLVSLLNANIKNYLLKMGANYTCVFDENMDYEFITDGGKCEYDNFSSGEKMRLLIASSFAFKDFMMTRTNIETNILVVDEFIDSNLDTKAINSILGILKEYAYLCGQSIYVISHRHEIDNSVFDKIIQVVKEKNISRITYLQ